jgi:hypothetical protein
MMISVVSFQQGQDGMRRVRDLWGGVNPGKEGVAEGLERFPVGFLGGSIDGALAQLAHKLYGEVIERMR